MHLRLLCLFGHRGPLETSLSIKIIMKLWIRLTLITMTVGGGFAGFAITLQSLFTTPASSTLVIMLVFIALYAFVTASGLLFVSDPARTGPLLTALAIQIPQFSSSVVAYRFAAGLEAAFGVSGLEKGSPHVDWKLVVGCYANVSFFQENPLRFGVNLAALASLLLLLLLQQPVGVPTPKEHSVAAADYLPRS